MITPNPHHPERNRFYSGLLVLLAIDAGILLILLSALVAAVRYVS